MSNINSPNHAVRRETGNPWLDTYRTVVPDVEASAPLTDSEKRKIGTALGAIAFGGLAMVGGNALVSDNTVPEAPAAIVAPADAEILEQNNIPASPDMNITVQAPQS